MFPRTGLKWCETFKRVENMAQVTVTDPARDYLAQLIEKQDVEGMGVRIFVTQPGTKNAETCLAYCPPNEVVPTDEQVDLEKFTLYLDHNSVPFLEEAYVDYSKDQMGGQLTIKAPNSRMPKIHEDSPLEDRINYILYNEINPGLASHGGHVSLEELTEDNIAVLKFGGGCQGCGMVDATLKHGVEKTLKDQLPQLSEVRDITDHSVRENAYYK